MTTPASARLAAAGRGRGGWIQGASWGYALVVLGVLALIRWVGEAWWGVTVLLFLPRWLFLGPLAVLALASGFCRRPAHWVMQGTMGLVIAGPLMGVSLPLRQLVASRTEGESVRVLSYNVRGGQIDVPGLIRYLERERVDVIGFQECARHSPAIEALLSRGWDCDESGFLASRFPITGRLDPLKVNPAGAGRSGALLHRIRVRTPGGAEIVVASVHMPTIRPGLYRFLEGDASGLEAQVGWWKEELDRVVNCLAECGETPLLVTGDFNMPSDDSSMAALREYLRFGFEDSGWGYGYTRPSKTPWFRIDHILSSPQWVFSRCWVGPDFGSDHLPLVAEAVLPLPSRNTDRARR